MKTSNTVYTGLYTGLECIDEFKELSKSWLPTDCIFHNFDSGLRYNKNIEYSISQFSSILFPFNAIERQLWIDFKACTYWCRSICSSFNSFEFTINDECRKFDAKDFRPSREFIRYSATCCMKARQIIKTKIEYFDRGWLHNEDGPALEETSSGFVEYYVHGDKIQEDDFWARKLGISSASFEIIRELMSCLSQNE